MYAARRVPFCNKENYNDKRVSRAHEKAKQRRLSRQENFTNNRDIAVELVEAKEPKKLSRYEQLLQWKKEKENLKKAEDGKKAKKKPPFKCGLVHHKPPPLLEDGCRRSARIMSLKNPAKEVKISNTKCHDITERKRNSQLPSSNKKFQSFAPERHQFKAPSNLSNICEKDPNVSKSTIHAQLHEAFLMLYPAQSAHCITRARGGDGRKNVSPRCEAMNISSISNKPQTPMKLAEMSKGTPSDLRRLVGMRSVQKAIEMPKERAWEKRKSPRTFSPVLSEEEADTLQTFRSLYEEEMVRLTDLCTHWDSLMSAEDGHEIPTEVLDSIFSTVGQTRLLMREKLAQFNHLLCKFKKKGSQSVEVVTQSDLQGFWDLVSIQVNDVDTKFRRLELLKWSNWVVMDEPEKERIRRRNVNKGISKNRKTSTSNSRVKDYISEQRKKFEAAKEKGTETFCSIGSYTVEDEHTNENTVVPQVHNTSTTMLEKRSSQMLTYGSELHAQGKSMTPKKSSKKVTFADFEGCSSKSRVHNTPTLCSNISKDTSAMDQKQNMLLLKSTTPPAPDGDLISWETPRKDFLCVGIRRSPRFSRDQLQ